MLATATICSRRMGIPPSFASASFSASVMDRWPGKSAPNVAGTDPDGPTAPPVVRDQIVRAGPRFTGPGARMTPAHRPRWPATTAGHHPAPPAVRRGLRSDLTTAHKRTSTFQNIGA
ncbi:hypothetical protein GCM10023324_61070 [Streptomyces youssoufiensis]